MSTTYYGQPWRISQVPTPVAAVNISSSTNASPTVITTSSAHGLQTGMAAIINGHTVNTNADGLWIVTITSSTTFKISTFSGFPGTFINGNGVGGATGTVQGLQLPGAALPEDAVDTQDAASVNTPLEALFDMTAWLAYIQLARVPGPYAVSDTPDADAGLDCTFEEYRIPNTLGGTRNYTLLSTSGTVPADGSRMKFSRTGALLTNGANFKREGGTQIASIAAGTPAGVEFVYRTSDNEWHVSAWSGNTTVDAVV